MRRLVTRLAPCPERRLDPSLYAVAERAALSAHTPWETQSSDPAACSGGHQRRDADSVSARRASLRSAPSISLMILARSAGSGGRSETTSAGSLILDLVTDAKKRRDSPHCAPRPFRRRGDAPGRRAARGPLRHRGYVMPIVSHAAAPPRYGGVLPPIFGFFMTTNSARARCSSADRPGAGSPRIATGSAMTRAAFARAITRRVRRSVGLAGGLSVGCLTLRPSAWRRGNAPHPRSTGARQRCALMC